MDWKDLIKFAGPMVAAGLPTIGGLLGGLTPIPGGSLAGEWIGKKIAAALGVPETPEAVNDALKSDPAVVDKLSAVENEASIELEKWKATLADVQDARGTTVELARIHSPMAYAPVVISTLVIVGFSIICLVSLKPDAAGVNRDITLFLLGAWASYMSQVVSYFLGSSNGSSNKTDQLAAIAAKATSAPIITRPGKK